MKETASYTLALCLHHDQESVLPGICSKVRFVDADVPFSSVMEIRNGPCGLRHWIPDAHGGSMRVSRQRTPKTLPAPGHQALTLAAAERYLSIWTRMSGSQPLSVDISVRSSFLLFEPVL